MTVYDARPDLRDVLFVAVSQSGGSPDLVEPLTRARTGGAITVAVTNTPGSPLARAAEYHLDILAGLERAVAATKTYTAQLLTLYLLAEGLRGSDGAEAAGIPALAEEVLAHEDAASSQDYARKHSSTWIGCRAGPVEASAVTLRRQKRLYSPLRPSVSMVVQPNAVNLIRFCAILGEAKMTDKPLV